MKDLQALAKRIPDAYVEQRQVGGGFNADYVSHGNITQMLLAKIGPFDQRIVQQVRDAETGRIVGCVLECRFQIDGREVTVQEVGEVDRMQAHDGANLKNAASDALKRCAMRVGLGLQLWTQESYRLDKALEASDGD